MSLSRKNNSVDMPQRSPGPSFLSSLAIRMFLAHEGVLPPAVLGRFVDPDVVQPVVLPPSTFPLSYA